MKRCRKGDLAVKSGGGLCEILACPSKRASAKRRPVYIIYVYCIHRIGYIILYRLYTGTLQALFMSPILYSMHVIECIYHTMFNRPRTRSMPIQ